MRALGVRCTKNSVRWVLLVGREREQAVVTERNLVSVPTGLERGAELAWARQEVIELVGRCRPDVVALRATEAGAKRISVGRAEMDGVVLEALTSKGLDARRLLAASVRGAFAAKNNAELASLVEGVAALDDVPKAYENTTMAALAIMPPG